MGKLLDYLMTGDWEGMQRMALYKKIGKKLDSLTDDEIEEMLEMIKEKRK